MKLKTKIFNIAATEGFADTLAEKLLAEYAGNELALADVWLLLPNRRACKTMADAFVRARGMSPTLLPHLLPIGDVEEGEIVLQDAPEQVIEALSPPIDEIERRLLFMKIILARPNDFGTERISLNQACFLAKELGQLIDMSYYQELNFADLQNLVPEEYASHWQETLKFLEIITSYWPKILQDMGKVDASFRKNKLIEKQAEIWSAVLPQKRVIVAGTTAGFVAIKKLVKAVLSLPQGEVYLSGLDKFLEEEAWDNIDESHPQFELKELLCFLQISRDDVVDVCVADIREKLVSEVMRPANETDKWRQLSLQKIEAKAIEGIHLIECDDVRQEALAIAQKMREVLETPQKTAALVTPDRSLARRVATQLKRWNIEVDDSAGKPLASSPWGIFMRLIAQVCQENPARVDILALLKNPLTALGKKSAMVRAAARELEEKVWRKQKEAPECEQVLQDLNALLNEFSQKCRQPKVSLRELLQAHIRVAESLAANDQKSGEENLWRGDDAAQGAAFLAQWLEKADILDEVDPKEYLGLFEAMLGGLMVRAKYGTHPRLSILGPIEARLNRFDVVILGEVNEGVWPQAAGADPWMSRPMKKDFGLPLPERAIGVLGADFAQLLCGKEVYLSRANRVQGTPMMKSRWWMRLKTVLEALGIKESALQDKTSLYLANKLEEPSHFEEPKPPLPTPPLAARPRQLSVSGIELLMRDPYSVFAKYILRLKPLDEIEPELTMADYGTIIHGILEEFNRKHPTHFPPNGREELLEMGRKKFAENEIANEKKVFWWPKFEKIVEHLAKLEEQYRQDIRRINPEVHGQMILDAAGGSFAVTATADRIDETLSGSLKIIDYKTGKARSVKEVEAGFAPQLPLEALIAEAGGFENLAAAKVEELLYWQLGVKDIVIAKDIAKILEDTKQRLLELIALYDFESTPYHCHPNLKKNPAYDDYTHLARVKEWSANES